MGTFQSLPWCVSNHTDSFLQIAVGMSSVYQIVPRLSVCLFIFLRKGRLIGKDCDVEKDWGQEEKGATEDEMVGWHHWLHGHEFE